MCLEVLVLAAWLLAEWEEPGAVHLALVLTDVVDLEGGMFDTVLAQEEIFEVAAPRVAVFALADQDVGLALCDAPQLVYLVLRKIWRVGDPDRPVLQGVYGILVADRLVVEATVLPDRVVCAPNGWTLRVIHLSLGVLSGRAYIVGLYVVRGAGAGLLPGVQHRECDEPRYEQHDNRAYYQVCPSGAS